MEKSQIDNVQEFVRIIGKNYIFWYFILNKKVTRFSQEVKYRIKSWNRTEEQGVAYYEIGKVVSVTAKNDLEILISIDYGNNFCVKYSKDRFIEQFDKIVPSIPIKKVIKAIEKEEETRKLEREKLEYQIKETERRNQEKQRALEKIVEKRKEEEKQAEIKRLEALEKEKQKQSLIRELAVLFKEKFLSVDSFYRERCIEYLSKDEYQAEKIKFVRFWLKENLGTPSDSEQATAIGTVESNVQVVARAGSGKTQTLVARALFLQKHCGVLPQEMLLLAFNKKAVHEIRERLTKNLQNSIPYVMTFHALAYALVHPEEDILFNEPDGEQSKSRALQTVIDDYLRDPHYLEKISILMKAYFREDWERIIAGGYDKSLQERLAYRRSLPRESIRGEYVKSFGEKVIADFLFEHNINYRYERNFLWNEINYRPDFTIFTSHNSGVIIEYFGLKGDTDYDKMSEQKKKFWQNREGWNLLDFCPHDLTKSSLDDFYALLKQSLEKHQISCNRLSEEEIWLRIKDRAIDRFTIAMENFVQLCRKRTLSPEKLSRIIVTHNCQNDVERRFLELVEVFYNAYLERLKTTGEEDFDGLMQRASEVVASGQTRFIQKSGEGNLNRIRYIFIDEYQDFSELFHRLIDAIRAQNPEVKLFCVGDDWQAINGFAGSDLYFYKNFERFWKPSIQLAITTNYRSANLIVNVSNQLMKDWGSPARHSNKLLGKVNIANISDFKPSLIEKTDCPGDIITPAVLRLIAKALEDNKNVVLLSRKNSLPWYVNFSKNNRNQNQLNNFLALVRSKFPETLRNKITLSTIHKYKGLEQEVVIILDAVHRCYPLLHPSVVFTFALGNSIQKVVDEERRLFYVALTRAVEHLIILTEDNNVSPFVEELKGKIYLPSIDWSKCAPVIGEARRITIKVTNQPGKRSQGTFAIKGLLRAEGYEWDSRLKAWWRNELAQNFSIQSFFSNSQWISQANGVQLQFSDELENVLASYTVDAGQPKCVFDCFANERAGD